MTGTAPHPGNCNKPGTVVPEGSASQGTTWAIEGTTWQPVRLSPRRIAQLTTIFLILGVAVRSVRYLLRFPLWEDECFYLVSLMDRGFLELLEPLEYRQVCPYLFSWVQLAIVKLLGFNEYTVRLFPFACGLGSLFLFWHLSRQLLRGTALLIAVAMFAVAYPMVRYAAETKPYGSDLFVSLILLTPAVCWYQGAARTRPLWILAAVIPLALGLSFPSIFIAGGISLFVAWVLLTSHDHRGWVPWTAYNLVLLGSFALVATVVLGNQNEATVQFMQMHWKQAFPPLDSLPELGRWLALTHTGKLLAFPVGDGKGASTATFVCCIVGLVTFYRCGRGPLVVLCVAPLALHFVASALHRYPYGDHVKFSMYLAPVVCLSAGLGTMAMLGWIARHVRYGHFGFAWTMLLLMVLGVGSIGRDFSHPYKTQSDMRARDFARWFWFNTEFEGEVACLQTDLDQAFSRQMGEELNYSAMYLCNQRIYSPRHAKGEPPRLDTVSAERPLRCAHYRVPGFDFDQAAFDEWFNQMKARYDLVGLEKYPFTRYAKGESKLVTVDYVEIFKFVPKGLATAADLQRPDPAANLQR